VKKFEYAAEKFLLLPALFSVSSAGETQEYQAYFEFSQRSQAGWIDA